MKHLVLLLLPLLTISLPHSIGEATQQLVYDTKGHELNSNSSYNIILADYYRIGGIRGLEVLDEFMYCTFFVGLHAHGDHSIFPVQFMLPSTDGVVGLSTNVTIKFPGKSTCTESMHWHVTNHSPKSSSELTKHVATGKRLIRMPPSVFRIERFGDTTEAGYKLVWCSKEGPCKDLGVQSSKNKNYLVSSDTPLAVVFMKEDA